MLWSIVHIQCEWWQHFRSHKCGYLSATKLANLYSMLLGGSSSTCLPIAIRWLYRRQFWFAFLNILRTRLFPRTGSLWFQKKTEETTRIPISSDWYNCRLCNIVNQCETISEQFLITFAREPSLAIIIVVVAHLSHIDPWGLVSWCICCCAASAPSD